MTVAPELMLGCPVWACSHWRGSLFSAHAKPADYLREYAQVFPTVEGNSTFYALPTSATVARWRDDTPPHFRFCFKFPKEITHGLRLRNAESETSAFLRLLAPLRDRLGPLMLQLSPRFSPREMDVLDRFLGDLSSEFDYAVEVRHPQYFNDPLQEAALNQLLRQRGADRVVFDTRCVHAADALDAATRTAQARKPALPSRPQSSRGERPIVRFVGQNNVQAAHDYLADWVEPVRHWLNEGKTVYFYAHTPDDRHAPALAHSFQSMLKQSLPALPLLSLPAAAQLAPAQGALF